LKIGEESGNHFFAEWEVDAFYRGGKNKARFDELKKSAYRIADNIVCGDFQQKGRWANFAAAVLESRKIEC
jgi:hypothetical protein